MNTYFLKKSKKILQLDFKGVSFVHERVLNLDISSIILIFKKRNLKFTLFCYFDGNDNNVVIMMSCMRFIFEWKNSELKNYEACSVIKYLKKLSPKNKKYETWGTHCVVVTRAKRVIISWLFVISAPVSVSNFYTLIGKV